MPESEESVTKRLIERFPHLAGRCAVVRARRITAEAPRELIAELAGFIKDTLLFPSLAMITGLDAGEEFLLIYHFAGSGGIVLSVKASVPKADPVFETVTEIYPGAVLYEVEARNLLGVTIKGIPEDIRYPLPDDWPEGQHPLRKDWTQPEAEQEKGGGCPNG
jgi:membrane-bound hydrogenase subunit beta